MPPSLPVYPGSDLDRPGALQGTLGTFWGHTFPDTAGLADVLTGKLLIEQRTWQLTQEALACASRRTVPVLHVEEWFPWTIQASQRNTTVAALAQFDDGLHNFDDGSLQFDRPAASAAVSYPAPPGLQGAAVITNKLTTTSRSLFPSQDFVVNGDSLQFQVDPFSDPAFSQTPITDNTGLATDQSITLWLFRAEFDQQQLNVQYGYLLPASLPSTDNGRKLLNALMDMLVSGSLQGSLAAAFSAMVDAPLVRTTETVQVTVLDSHGLLVATDQQTYRFPATARLAVNVGDSVTAGQALTDALQITKLTPDNNLPALSISSDFMGGCYLGELSFPNLAVPLQVSTDSDGYTYLQWQLGGFPADVQQFFDTLQARGLAELQRLTGPNAPSRFGTLAHYLDTRQFAAVEPGPADLPATINPFQFLCRNCLQYNAYLVQIRKASCGLNGAGLQFAKQLTALLPPQIVVFVVIELSVPQTVISSSRWVASPQTGLGVTAPLTSLAGSRLISQVTPRLVSRRCR